jgi:hypothetical protein
LSGVREPFGHDTREWSSHLGLGIDALTVRELLDRLPGDAEQFQARSRALDARPLGGVLGMDPLEILPARGPKLHQLFGASQLALVGRELGSARHVTCRCVGEFRTENRRDHLPLMYSSAEVGQHASDPTRHERSDGDALVHVGLDDRWQPQRSGPRGRLNAGDSDPRSLNRIFAQ